MRIALTILSVIVFSICFELYFFCKLMEADINPVYNRMLFLVALAGSILVNTYNRKLGLLSWYHERANEALLKNIVFFTAVCMLYYGTSFVADEVKQPYIAGVLLMLCSVVDWSITWLIGRRNKLFSTKIA